MEIAGGDAPGELFPTESHGVPLVPIKYILLPMLYYWAIHVYIDSRRLFLTFSPPCAASLGDAFTRIGETVVAVYQYCVKSSIATSRYCSSEGACA